MKFRVVPAICGAGSGLARLPVRPLVRRGALLLILGLVIACAFQRVAGPTPPAVTRITEDAARSLALTIAQTDDFHFTGTTGPVTNVRADVMTFSAAMQDLDNQQMGCGCDQAAEATKVWVWVVIMDGSWPQNFPVLATPAPTFAPWRSIAVVLDATTGAMIRVGGRK